MLNNNSEYVHRPLPNKVSKIGVILVVVGVALGIISFIFDSNRALYSYLLAYVFLISIAIGALFLVSLEYVANADWSTPLRRVPEFFSSMIPFLIVLAIPLLFFMHDIFHWTHTEVVQKDTMLTSKSPYLNIPFFIVRLVLVFAIWSFFYFKVIKNSRKQDSTKEQVHTKSNIKYSAIFIPVFAITSTIVAIDWIMSLEPHWYSTIFGVYFFSGNVVGSLAVVTLVSVLLKEKGYLHPKVVDDHFFSLGGLMFAFINFWGYIAFSQYLLIWYANLPEETYWFIQRWDGVWAFVSILLIIVHFVVPYSVLLSQPAKMNPKKLKFISIWLIIAHLVDLYWLIMPSVKANNYGILNIIFELSFPIASVGGMILIFFWNSQKHNLVPIGDPKLERGLKFRL